MGTSFLPALLTPLFVARLERPPPHFVLPMIYAVEAAAFAALALLADHFSLAAVVAIAALDGALALTAKALTRAVTVADARARGRATGWQRHPQRRLHRGRGGGPGPGRRRRRWPSASRRRCCSTPSPSTDRLPHAHGEAPPPSGVRRRPPVRSDARRPRLHPRPPDAAAPARRRGRRRSSSSRSSFRSRWSTPRTRWGWAIPATGCCSAAGESEWWSAASSLPPCAVLRYRCSSSSAPSRSGSATWGWQPPRLSRSPVPPRSLGGTGNGIQWVDHGQRGAGADVRGDAGAGDRHARILLLGDARPRLPARRPDRLLLRVREPPSSSPESASLAIVVVATPVLRGQWAERLSRADPGDLDAGDEIVVELIPAGREFVRSDYAEVRAGEAGSRFSLARVGGVRGAWALPPAAARAAARKVAR